MHPEVRARFMGFSVPKEGRVDCLYLDKDGWVTCGVGNLMEDIRNRRPAPIVFTLPWKRRADNQPATRAQIDAEWQMVKARQDLKGSKIGPRRAITTLYLEEADIDALVYRKLDEHDRDLARQFPEWETWPWQAQLATHSMAWAMGSGFGHPKFRAACKRRDWVTAAAECAIGGEAENPGLKPRNEANKALFLEAAGAPALPPMPDPRGRVRAGADTIAVQPAPAASGWRALLARILASLKGGTA